MPESPERQQAWRLANDRLGLTVRLRGTGASTSPGSASSKRLIGAAQRLERGVLTGVRAHPELNRARGARLRSTSTPSSPPGGRSSCSAARPRPRSSWPLLAELDAVAELEGIDVETAKHPLLRLRERRLQRELERAEEEPLIELQHRLAEIRTAIREFA